MEEIQKAKILIAIPSGRGEVDIMFATKLVDMILKTKEKYPEVKLAISYCGRTYIHQARQTLADTFLNESKADRILYIDDDNIPENDSLIKLLEMDLPIASGIYFKRKEPFEPIIMLERNGGIGSERRPDLWRDGIKEPFKVHSTGFGFILIKREVMEKMKTLGIPMFDMRGGIGEDIWFCIQASAVNYEVIVNPMVEVGHLGDKPVITGEDYRKFYAENVSRAIREAEMIDGYMTSEELKVLAEEAINCDNIIEVGSWLGRSARVLALSKRLWCVDQFDGKLDGKAKSQIGEKSQLDQFKENIKFQNVRVVQGNSVEMAKEFKDDLVDTVFIDAGHTEEECYNDLVAYFPKVRIGGKMLVHDYCKEWLSVIGAVNKFCKEYQSISAGRLIPNTSIYEIIKL